MAGMHKHPAPLRSQEAWYNIDSTDSRREQEQYVQYTMTMFKQASLVHCRFSSAALQPPKWNSLAHLQQIQPLAV